MKVNEECPYCGREVKIEAGDWQALRNLLRDGCDKCPADVRVKRQRAQQPQYPNAPPP